MKEALTHIGRVLMGILLIITAIVLIIIVTPVAIVRTIYVSVFHENRKARDILTGISTYFIALASSIDKFGNCAFGGLLNDFFLIEKKYEFGRNHETVSEVLGWSEKLGDLNKKGLLLVKILDFIEKDHCKLAMESGLKRAQEKITVNESISQ